MCVIGAVAGGSKTALAQVAGNVGATCRVNSRLQVGDVHPTRAEP
jgi:hypothetical protein